MFPKLTLLAAIGLASANAMACYTVYDATNSVAYQAQTPPVDMSRPVSQTLPRRFPGGHLVFDATQLDCPRIDQVAQVRRAGPSSGRTAAASPLLTDRATAAELGVPHRTMGNAAVIPPQVVARLELPTYSEIPTDPPAVNVMAASQQDPTRAMGAGPAMDPTRVMGAGPAMDPTRVMGAGPAPQREPATRIGYANGHGIRIVR